MHRMEGISLTGMFLLVMIRLPAAQRQHRLLKDFCIEARRTCFHLYEENIQGLGWWQANDSCVDFNSHLVAIMSSQVQERIQEEFAKSFTNVEKKAWIGGRESLNDKWRWLDGTVYDGRLSSLTSEKDYNTCAVIGEPGIKISSKRCAEKEWAYICSFLPGAGDCDGSPTEVHIQTDPRRCHNFYISGVQLTWYEAHNRCTREGGTLASFNLYSDQTQEQYFQNLTRSTLAWIGLRRRMWTWKSLSPSPIFNYTKWTDGAPSHYDENCAFLDFEKAGWGDGVCNDHLPYFICQNYTNEDNTISTTTILNTSMMRKVTLPTTSLPSFNVITDGPKGNGLALNEEDLIILVAVLVAVGVLVIAAVIAVVLIRRKKSTTRKSTQDTTRQGVTNQQVGDAEPQPDEHVYTTSLPNAAPTPVYANPNHINSRVDGNIDAAGYSEVAKDQSSRESGINHYAEVTDHHEPELRKADTSSLGTLTPRAGQYVNSSLSVNSVDHKIAPDTGDIYRLPDKGNKDNEFAPQNDYELAIRENSLYVK